MAGLRDTLARLAQLRRRLDGLLKSAAQYPAKAFGPTAVGRLSEVTSFGSNPGNLRMLTHMRRNLPDAPALVVALHGCTQTAADYDRGSGWSQLAYTHGFALLFPEQKRANNPNNCFNWFLPGDTTRGVGEALSIRQMIDQMVEEQGIDRRRVFIVGLSAGGAMAAAIPPLALLSLHAFGFVVPQATLWFVIGIEDQMVPVALQRSEVKTIGATTLELHSSHVPMISQADEVADFIVSAAQSL